MQPEHRRIRFVISGFGLALSCAVAFGVSSPDHASALTLSVGQVVDDSAGGVYSSLEMDGGELRIGIPSTGGPLTLSVTDAILARGMINHWYAQSGVTSIHFFGTTTVPGAPTGPFPADGMYLRASPFDSLGLNVVNKGTFVQSGTGELKLLGTARFVGDLFSTYFFDNDFGITTAGQPDATLINNGSSFIKRSGVGTSVINVPIIHNSGKFEVWNGSLALQAGGTYQSAVFYADAFGTNSAGALRFSGGTHVFQGFTTTELGNFVIDPGVMVRAATTTPNNGGAGEWIQRANLVVDGAIDLDGSVLNNTGTIETRFAGAITGRTTGGMIGTFQNSGNFTGNILDVAVPPVVAGVIEVQNDGQFVLASNQVARTGAFINLAGGMLEVNGELTSSQLELRGGVLRGSGLINGDVFVGGDATTAVFTPGNSPGTMTIDGAYTQEANGELELEIAGIAAGEYDVVDASGGLAFDGGTIRFERDPAYAGDVGAQIDFFAGRPISIGPNVAIVDNTGFELEFDPDSGIATITVPEPDSMALLASGLVGFVWLARSRRGLRA